MGQLADSSLNCSQESGRSDTLSVYGEGVFSKDTFIKNIKDLQQAFPQLPVGFYDTLHDRLVENGFTDQRLSDAIGNVIDTCVYPIPTIANIISWDRMIKRYTHNQMCDMAIQFGAGIWDSHLCVECVENRVYWISKADADQYCIKGKLNGNTFR